MFKRVEFSKSIILFETLLVALVTWRVLEMAELCIYLNYTGSLVLLTPITTAVYAAYGVSVGYYYTKAKAENLAKMTTAELVTDLPVGYGSGESMKGDIACQDSPFPSVPKPSSNVDADPL